MMKQLTGAQIVIRMFERARRGYRFWVSGRSDLKRL